MSQSKDVCKNTTMEDIASMPNNHRRTFDIMADYLEGRITFAAAKEENEKENTVDKESNNREYTFTHVPSKEQEMTNTTTTKTGNLQQKDTSTKIIGSLGYPQENQDSYRYFGDHDFSTLLFDEHEDKPWPLIN